MNARTLIIHTGALGDFLLACPAVEALHRTAPVDLYGHPERHALAVAAGIASQAHALDALALHEALATEGMLAAPRFAAAVRPYSRAVVWMRDPDGTIARAFRAAGVADVRCLPGLPAAAWRGHASAYYLDCLGLSPVKTYRLQLPALEGLDVIIHPGSGSRGKNWPLERFQAVAERLEAQGRHVDWLLGPAEEDIRLPDGAKRLEAPDLTALARLLAEARLYIGNDSGVTHLASLTGCPTVAIFGVSAPAIWAPIGPKAHVCMGNPWPAPEEVLRLVERIDNGALAI